VERLRKVIAEPRYEHMMVDMVGDGIDWNDDWIKNRGCDHD
jgi:hypothetical protein